MNNVLASLISPTALALWGVMALCALTPSTVPLGDPGGPSVYVEVSSYQAQRVTPAQVSARRAKGEDFLVVDVRPAESYKAEHIKGAINSAWRDMEQGHTLLPKERLLLLYCT